MTYFKKILLALGLAAGLAGVANVATAQNADVGVNQNGLQGFPGLDIALGTTATVTGCNTGTPVITGGATTGKITTVGTTACTPTLTYKIPALVQNQVAPTLGGLFCWVIDLTHPAVIFTEASTLYTAPTLTAQGTLSCTFTASGAITAADVLLYAVQGF
jgi:hypothetical protein